MGARWSRRDAMRSRRYSCAPPAVLLASTHARRRLKQPRHWGVSDARNASGGAPARAVRMADLEAPAELRSGGSLPPPPLFTPPEHKSFCHRALVHTQDTFLDLYATFCTFALHLITLETLLLCVVSAGCVAFYCRWYRDGGAYQAAPAVALCAAQGGNRVLTCARQACR